MYRILLARKNRASDQGFFVKKEVKKANGKILEIFCDGGFGNRYNSLVSGLALAELCGLQVKVYWPKNGSCEAGYDDIFATRLSVHELSLPELSGTLADAYCLLHDTLGSETLKVPFHSAYDYSSVAEFAAQVLSQSHRIFYYPALIPTWIDENAIHRLVKALEIKEDLVLEASKFIKQNLPEPFYGIHLRRTDLSVGLSDNEVQILVKKHRNEKFFVCSDDPIAEAIAAANPNVFRREKSNHVGKRNPDAHWQSPTADDSGRVYFSNIQRSRDATLEGVIDLLVLAQSQIISFTGSTFQSVARLIGSIREKSGLNELSPIPFTACGDICRMIRNRSLSLTKLMGVCEELIASDRVEDAMLLLREALEQEIGTSRFVVLFNLGVYSMGLQRYQHAMIYFKAALDIMPESAEAKDAYFRVAQLELSRFAK